jgi:predicted transcriptional regulator
MTNAMTVRLTEETDRQLTELAEHYPSRSAAVQGAIHRAWRQLQDEKLEAGYAALAASETPEERTEQRRIARRRRPTWADED